MIKSSQRSWFTNRCTFSKYPNTELRLTFDTIYYYNMFDDGYFPNSPQRWRRWDHCFLVFFSPWNKWYRRPSRSSPTTVQALFFLSSSPRALNHDHPPPWLQTAICSPQIHITQHPGVPYTGEKLSIPVSFLRLGSRARALAAHTLEATDDDGGRKKRKKYNTCIHIYLMPNFWKCRFLSAAAAAAVMAPV